ncbi:MAG: prepilin-type N-terminal cleavage/methylation domain-containing protein [Actinomycetota bacterium]
MARRGDTGQSGFTLVELLVVVLMAGILGAMALVTFTSGSEALGRADDDSRGQQDLRIVSERLSRDVRAARGVDAGSTGTSLTIWIDADANYRKSPAETITWSLSTNPDDPKHFNVQRSTGAGDTATVGQALVSGIAFAYDASDVTQSRVITVTMTYDAIVDAYLTQKQVTYKVRMRNVQ